MLEDYRTSIGRQGPDKVPSYDVPFTLLTKACTSASRPHGFVSLDYRFQMTYNQVFFIEANLKI